MRSQTLNLFCFLIAALVICSAQVIELNDSILEETDNGPWLINFYAPWCGYCRRLEPTYEKVGQYFSSIGSPVKVARLDATTYLKAGRFFQVDGFPTIKFVDKRHSFTYNGDRSFISLITFAIRANGPAVKILSTSTQFEGNMSLIKPDPFFVLIDHCDSPVKMAYEKLAEQYRLLMWFFAVPSSGVISTGYARFVEQAEQPYRCVIVFKDADGFVFPGVSSSDDLQSSSIPYTVVERELRDWLLRERYPVYMETRVNDLWEFGSTEIAILETTSGANVKSITLVDGAPFTYRLIALFLLNPSHLNDASSQQFKEFGRNLAHRRLPELMKRFQFAWTDQQLDVLSNLAMVSLTPPSLIVVDPITRLIYLNPNQTHVNGLFSLESDVIISYLLAVADGRVPGYGGNTISIRLRRLAYNFVIGLTDFVRTSPIIALLVFGIPTMFLGCVGYLCCCMDEQFDEFGEDRRPVEVYTDRAPLLTDGVGDVQKPDETGDTDSGPTQRRRVPQTSRRVREVAELGPVVSKEEIESRKAAYQEWKKSA